MKISDTLVGAGFATAGALVVTATLGYPAGDVGQPGPALFPRLVGGLMAAFGVLLALQGARARDASGSVAWRELRHNESFINAVFVILGVLAYLLLSERLGFLLTAAAVMFVLMWRLRVAVAKAAMVAVLFTLAVYVLFFKILRVPLPTGLVWW